MSAREIVKGVPSRRYQRARARALTTHPEIPAKKHVRRARSGVWHIYFIQAERLGLIKIGKTTDVGARFRQMQTSSPDRLKLIATALCVEDGLLETKLHSMFNAHREHGEWHRPDPGILNYIAANGLEPGTSEAEFMRLFVLPVLQQARAGGTTP